MTKAEERALEAYPDLKEGEFDDIDAEIWIKQTIPHCRRGFVKGYKQAEKDLAFAPDNKRPKTWSKRAKEALKPYFGNSESKLAEIFAAGYMQAEEDLGWISVKDRKPAPSEWVVVCHKDHGVPQCLALATYNEETGEWHTDDWEDGEREIYFPDYWMPIPKFKEEEKWKV